MNYRHINRQKLRRRKVLALFVFTCEIVYKPSSVFDGHLSRPYISARFKRVGDLRATLASPFLHRVGFTPRLVANLRVSSYLAFPSLPLRAVVFCCTVLEVTFTGSYPAPLPYDARTFLNISCDRLANSLTQYSIDFWIFQVKNAVNLNLLRRFSLFCKLFSILTSLLCIYPPKRASLLRAESRIANNCHRR